MPVMCYEYIYSIDKSVLVENRSLIKFIRNYIRDSSGVFSISEDIDDVTCRFILVFVQKYSSIRNPAVMNPYNLIRSF